MNMRKLNNQKFTTGFTLIELLVVIAIIGILSGIVLTSLGTARNKAKVASAEASMSSMRAEAELGVSNNGVYVNDICTGSGSGTLTNLIAAVTGQNIGVVDCDPAGANITAWAAELDYTDSIKSGYFCVDSTGFSGTRVNPKGATVTACPSS